jgi:hypothetical protein
LKSYKSDIKKYKTAALKQWTRAAAIKSEVSQAQTHTVEERKDNVCNNTDDYVNLEFVEAHFTFAFCDTLKS